MGDYWHINNGTHWLPHIWPFIFTPTSAKNPSFYQKLSPKVLFFFTLSRIFEIFYSKTPNRLEFEKKVSKCPLFLWLLSLKDPLFFALHAHVCFRGMLLPQTQSEAGNFFAFSKQNRAIWWIFSGANLIKVMKIKFHFYMLKQPNCALWMKFIGGQGWYTGHYPPGQTRKGISYNHPL